MGQNIVRHMAAASSALTLRITKKFMMKSMNYGERMTTAQVIVVVKNLKNVSVDLL